MNKLDKQYTDLLQDILDNGVKKQDRTGTGTISVFGRQIRHNMKDGFPLLTTKKMPFKTIVTELLWFLRGDTNIKYLVDNNCHIWDGDAYKNYKVKTEIMMGHGFHGTLLSQEEFINKIKTDDEFAKTWGELGPIYGKQWRSWKNPSFPKISKEFSDICDGRTHIEVDYPIDQISELITQLKENPDSRRLMVNAWAVHDLPKMVLPPCHYGFQVYTRELSLEERLPKKIKLTGHGGEIEFSLTDKREIVYYGKTKESNESLERVEKIKDNEVFYQTEFGWGVFLDTNTFETVSYDGTEWGGHKLNIPTRAISLMWNQRSVDTFLGLPFNIASYGLLLEIIAKEVNMVPDELIGNLGDVHLYSNHLDAAKEQIGRELTFDERKQIAENEGWYERDNFLESLKNTSDDTAFVFNFFEIQKRTREPFPLPTLKFNPCPITGIDMEYQSIAQFQIENYQSHPTIKAPLSN